jgi:hypothetical protein
MNYSAADIESMGHISTGARSVNMPGHGALVAAAMRLDVEANAVRAFRAPDGMWDICVRKGSPRFQSEPMLPR